MWMMDRELEEHQVYDHFSTTPVAGSSLTTVQNQQHPMYPNGVGGGGGPPNGIYAHLQPPHSSTPTTTNSMGMDSSLNGGSPPPPMDMDSNSLHQHSTLPAVDHRLAMDTHHLEADQNDIYGQNLYHQPQHHYLTESGLLVTSSSSGLGGPYGDQETTMMMPSPNGHDAELLGHHGGTHHGLLEESHHVPVMHSAAASSKKSKDIGQNYLQIYARQLGLNDRGCYVAVGLAGLAFLLFVIVIAMGATWPGKD